MTETTHIDIPEASQPLPLKPQGPEYIRLPKTGTMPEVPYFKCYRSEVAMELLAASKNAFLLLYQITFRAKRTDSFNRYNLAIGEALVGDFKNIDLTEGQYREAKKFLAKHHFATFKATNKGTIAKLINFEVFNPNLEDSNGQHNTPATNQRRTNNEPTTTNKNDKNDKNENNDKNEKGKAFREKKEISPNVQLIQLGEAIKEQKENMRLYKLQHITEYAIGSSWDSGRREGYVQMKSKYQQLKEKSEKLLLET